MPSNFINLDKEFMINTRGSVKEVLSNETELRLSQGWKIVRNPKRSYFPEFDTSAGGKSAPDNLMDDLSDEDVLPGVFV